MVNGPRKKEKTNPGHTGNDGQTDCIPPWQQKDSSEYHTNTQHEPSHFPKTITILPTEDKSPLDRLPISSCTSLIVLVGLCLGIGLSSVAREGKCGRGRSWEDRHGRVGFECGGCGLRRPIVIRESIRDRGGEFESKKTVSMQEWRRGKEGDSEVKGRRRKFENGYGNKDSDLDGLPPDTRCPFPGRILDDRLVRASL